MDASSSGKTAVVSRRRAVIGFPVAGKLVAAGFGSSRRLGRIAAHPIGASVCLALGYMGLCSAYIFISGHMAAGAAGSVGQLRNLELLKGVAFVLVTGAGYFGFAALLLKRIAVQQQHLARLSSHLLRSQDEERRRIGRELHDSTAQELVAVAMNLGLVQERGAGRDALADNLLTDSQAIIEHCQRELRTLSYRLYPPVLEEVGLAGAVRTYADGFTQRSGIRVTLDAGPALGRLPADTERALFRVVQESLGNIHRHSGSTTAAIRLARKAGELVLEVADQGCGLPVREIGAAAKVGVGLAGMRERVSQLGGRFELESSGRGTTVRAIVPAEGGTDEYPADSDRR